MLAKLEMKLTKTDDMSYQMSSLFHGVLMQLIDENYADELHSSKLHPYSQHIERRGDDWYWIVNTLSEKACDVLIKDSLLKINCIYLNKKNLSIGIEEKKYTELNDRELADCFYKEKAERYVTLQFLTPTAFKMNGRYINLPDIELIFANIMNKYDAANANDTVKDEETLMQLTQYTSLNRYELRSTLFSLEGIRIPAFTGKMTLKLNGTQTMCSFSNMLLKFSEYSGIGIKTSLGMGAVRVIQERKQ